MSNKNRAREEFRQMRQDARRRGDHTFEPLELHRHDAGELEPDWMPAAPVRRLGWFLLAVIFLGSMIFLGARVAWQLPVGLILVVFIAALPSLIEVMCRGNTVIKHDRGGWWFWW